MHPHWYRQEHRDPTFVPTWNGTRRCWDLVHELEEAYRAARAAQQNLESAEFRYARESEQLHTTIAALEHSARSEAARLVKLQEQVRKTNSQFAQLRSAKRESEQRCEQLAAELRKLRSQDRQAIESYRAKLATKESEVSLWKQQTRATQTRLEQNEILLSESASSIDQLSSLVGILRTDHEFSELLVDDLETLCSRMEMSQSDLVEGLSELSSNTQNRDELVRRMNDYEIEREQNIQQLELTEKRLSDCQYLLQHERENARQIASAAQGFEAEVTIEMSEMELQHAIEVQRLQDEIEKRNGQSDHQNSQVQQTSSQLTEFNEQFADEQELWNVEREKLQSQISEATTALKSASCESSRLQETIDQLGQNVVSLQSQLGESNDLADQRQNTISDLTEQVEELSIQSVSQQSELDRRAQYLAQQANQIASLQNEVEQISGLKRSRDLAMQNSQSQAQRASDLENQLADAKAEIEKLRDLLDSNDRRAA